MNRPSRRRFLSVLALASPVAAGCTSVSDEPPVGVLLSDIAPGQGGGVGDAPLLLVVRLENASPEPITIEGCSYRIRLNGTDIGRGLSNETLPLDRLSTATVRVPVHLSTVRLLGSLYRILNSSQVTYELDATLYVQRGSRSRKYRVTREGAMDLKEVQQTLEGLGNPPAGTP